MADTDVRIVDVAFSYEDHRYRTPIKFGGVALDKVTLLNVTMTVETVGGTVARGFGSMPLGNVWAWPSKTLKYDETLAGMKKAAEVIANVFRKESVRHSHPIRFSHAIESLIVEWAVRQDMPALATLVVNSAFDAALHDAYGKAHGVNCYHTYGPPFFDDDLGDYLGDEFRGEKLHNYIARNPQPSLPLYHLVGALDPLTANEVKEPVGDGLPEHLGEWITRDGLTHLKVKLNGDDAGWDVARVVGVNRVASETAPERAFQFSLDFNERCRNVEYLLEVLHRIREQSPAAFDRIQYVEQPTARDLKANPANRMHEAAKLKPVVIDESLLDLETLQQARDLGYTGVAFKACKGQTQSLLLAAAAQKYGLFRCVQDLTCPGASLIHSAGLAAHIPGVAAIEANSRQYCPAANEPWDERFPGVFTIRNGRMNTGLLTGPGLGAGYTRGDGIAVACPVRAKGRTMTDPTVNPVPGSRFNRAWRKVRNWAKGESPTADQKLEQVRAKTPAPVLWLYGKTQSGKTSVVRFLTGATDAEIGNGFRPCTRHSRQYPFPTEDAPVFTFLDTRGVDEPGYDPAEEIAAFDAQAHLLIVTCRVTDFATGRLRETLKAVRDANPRRPVLLVLTCLHEAYPQQQHPQPYPFGSPLPAGGEGSEVPRLLALQQQHFAGLVDRVVPVDLTRPEEGFDDPNYGGEALKAAILELLPTAFRETLRHLTDAQQQFRDRHSRRAAPVLVGYSSLAATAGALPIPFVDLLTIPAVQARMVKVLADLSGNQEAGRRFLELSASAGVGLLAAVGARQLVKLIPYVGSVVGAGLAGASTYALGRAFLEYDRRVNDGHLPDKAEVARLYREHLAAAERSWGRK